MSETPVIVPEVGPGVVIVIPVSSLTVFLSSKQKTSRRNFILLEASWPLSSGTSLGPLDRSHDSNSGHYYGSPKAPVQSRLTVCFTEQNTVIQSKACSFYSIVLSLVKQKYDTGQVLF